jgi:hypothetical protein
MREEMSTEGFRRVDKATVNFAMSVLMEQLFAHRIEYCDFCSEIFF